MDFRLEDVVVINNEEASRFETTIGGLRALITYRRSPHRIAFLHAEVPAPLEGQGLAAKLAKTALDFARANRLQVVPLCPYVLSYVRKHREYYDLVAPDQVQNVLQD